MSYFNYQHATYSIRADLPEAYRRYWETLAKAGTWWTGEERVAIAQETRNAITCAFCAARKKAISPYAVEGRHDHSGNLPERVVDAVHRVITDQSRITQDFVDRNAAHGLTKEAYVELVGVAVAVFSIDEFHRALGMPLEPLPVPQPGAPSGHRPQRLSDDVGFVPTVPANGAIGLEADLWPPHFSANVLRALSLVPNALREWKALAGAQYLTPEQMPDYRRDLGRALNRVQMELVAGRVSAVNECFY